MATEPICGASCYYGGMSAARKYSSSDLGRMWHCNRRVKNEGDRCWQHPEAPADKDLHPLTPPPV